METQLNILTFHLESMSKVTCQLISAHSVGHSFKTSANGPWFKVYILTSFLFYHPTPFLVEAPRLYFIVAYFLIICYTKSATLFSFGYNKGCITCMQVIEGHLSKCFFNLNDINLSPLVVRRALRPVGILLHLLYESYF